MFFLFPNSSFSSLLMALSQIDFIKKKKMKKAYSVTIKGAN